MKRREALRWLSAGAAASSADLISSLSPQGDNTAVFARDGQTPQALKGLSPVKITNIKTILTAPDRIRLVIVKIETSEPGLYGVGCATFTQRALVVATAIEQ